MMALLFKEIAPSTAIVDLEAKGSFVASLTRAKALTSRLSEEDPARASS